MQKGFEGGNTPGRLTPTSSSPDLSAGSRARWKNPRGWTSADTVGFRPYRLSAVILALEVERYNSVGAARRLDVGVKVVRHAIKEELRLLSGRDVKIHALPTLNYRELKLRFLAGERFDVRRVLSVDALLANLCNASEWNRKLDVLPAQPLSLQRGAADVSYQLPWQAVRTAAIAQARRSSADSSEVMAASLGVKLLTAIRMREEIAGISVIPDLELPTLVLSDLRRLYLDGHEFRRRVRSVNQTSQSLRRTVGRITERVSSNSPSTPDQATPDQATPDQATSVQTASAHVKRTRLRSARAKEARIAELRKRACELANIGEFSLWTVDIPKLVRCAVRLAYASGARRPIEVAHRLNISSYELEEMLREHGMETPTTDTRRTSAPPDHSQSSSHVTVTAIGEAAISHTLPTLNLLELYDACLTAVRQVSPRVEVQREILGITGREFRRIANVVKDWRSIPLAMR